MYDEALEAVRVTADRVKRFSRAVETDPTGENRHLWRAALDDLTHAIRQGRAEGCNAEELQDAATGATADA